MPIISFCECEIREQHEQALENTCEPLVIRTTLELDIKHSRKTNILVQVSQVRNISDIAPTFPDDFSFFNPYLGHFISETLRIGGEVYVSRNQQGLVSGILIYDEVENTGTIFTKSREVFDTFYELIPRGLFFAELKTERECEIYDLYSLALKSLETDHVFRHEISMLEESQIDEIQRFMVMTHPRLNKKWVRTALANGENCLLVKLGDEIAGLGWVSLVNGVGRLHSLFVTPRFRRMGIGEDILHARLLWLKSKGAKAAFSEISRENVASSRIATKGRMKVSGEIFQYAKKAPVPKPEPRRMPVSA